MHFALTLTFSEILTAKIVDLESLGRLVKQLKSMAKY